MKQFRSLETGIMNGSIEAQENLKFLECLQEPCEQLAKATPEGIPALLPKARGQDCDPTRPKRLRKRPEQANQRHELRRSENTPNANENVQNTPTLSGLWSRSAECAARCASGCWRDQALEVLHCVRMIWTISTHYNTPDRISGLLRKISNEIIRRCQATIDLDLIFEGDVPRESGTTWAVAKMSW